MKPSDKNNVIDLVSGLQQGTASRSDLVAILIMIREHITGDKVILLDIAHCVAHTKRDRGSAFTYISSFIDSFIEIANNGGVLKVDTLFPIEDVIIQLGETLIELGVNSTQSDLLIKRQSYIKQLLMDILDGTEIAIVHDKVKSCHFSKGLDKQTVIFSFNVYFKDMENARVLQIPQNVAMAFPVLS